LRTSARLQRNIVAARKRPYESCHAIPGNIVWQSAHRAVPGISVSNNRPQIATKTKPRHDLSDAHRSKIRTVESLLAAHRAYLLGWNAGPAGGPDLVTYRSGVPHATLNGVLRVSGLTPRDALAEARERLDGVPRVWWAGPEGDAGTAEALTSLGAVHLARLPIMTVPIDQVTPAPTPGGLEIAETKDMDEFVSAYGAVSGIPVDGVPAAIAREKEFAGDGTVIRLAGRFGDGYIAGTAVAWLSHGLLTVYFVGTQPGHRRRGVGAAMTAAAIELARDRGVRTAALTSSKMGESLYRRLGFRTVGTFDLLSF
jgi:GNAT superfamily N-acetyltransferase